MAKTLVLAEKPSVGKDIAKVLGCKSGGQGFMEGDKYIVTWALGHLVTLADPESYNKKYEKWDINDLPIIPKKLELEVIGKTSKQYHVVKTLAYRKDVDAIIIATDAGREGELVARWILEKANIHKPLKRLWISSVTDKAIKEGFQKLKDAKLYENLYKSAVARSQADWLIGINATRALTSKHNAQLSCGRVQTPTLAMISKREEEIKKFVPKNYYGITAKAKDIVFTWQDKNSSSTFDSERCDTIIKQITGKDAVVADISKTDKKTNPPLLYDLTQLQADANKMFGFSAKDTLSIMQSLYETHKILTYPRTDSRYLTTDITDTLHERIRACAVGNYKKFCAKLASVKFSKNAFYINDAKVSDHHAIIPTEQFVNIEKLSDKERKIYDLVIKRFLAALYPPFEYEQTEITLKIGSENFKAKGKKVKSMGYREIFNDDDEPNTQLLPDIKKGEALKISQLQKTSGKTKPPSPFNEASLLMAMENPSQYMDTENKELLKTISETGGLGTVATRADIIEKLFNSFVVEKRGKDIFITGKGRQLLQLAPKELVSPMLTAKWEQRLQRISKGQEDFNVFLNEITEYTKAIIGGIKTSNEKFKHDNITFERCPNCGQFLLNISGKKGKMLVCQDRTCGFKRNLSVVTNARCPVCHKKLELIGEGEKRKFVCVCGHKENYTAFQERREKEGDKMSKKEVEQFLQKQNKTETVNSSIADALSKLKFD